MEKKKAYIDDLLLNIKNLEERVIASRDANALPFSFFKEAFGKTEQIMRLLHELEHFQIEEMKAQMEKLVVFLSETENKKQAENQPLALKEDPETEKTEEVSSALPDTELIPQQSQPIEEVAPPRNKYAEGIVLPGYKRPETAENAAQPVTATEEEKKETEVPAIASLNDTIQKEPSVLDMKRGLSLNDRFLFQRELFNNDRFAMNDIMIKLNAFDNYPDTDNYLRQSTTWNFEDQTVKDFLLAIKKGFE